jgi:heterodisulfide reductase subunit B
MKTYALFPGCSLEKVAQSYLRSTLEVADKLGIQLKELNDWNCCGATAYFHVDELLAYTLSARNLAMAEQEGLDVVAPCAACYKNMYFTSAYLKEDPDLAEHINFALQEDGLHFSGRVGVRHLLEVLAQDVTPEEIKGVTTKPLKGLRVVPYYGCQVLRPRKDDEDVEQPMFFEALLSAIGATPVDYPYKLRCCSGSLIMTSRPAALSLVRDLLQLAADREAAVIATACPMCQVNLECYQQQVNQEFGTRLSMPVLYFTQIMGLAFGVPPNRLGIGSELVSASPVAHFMESLPLEAQTS